MDCAKAKQYISEYTDGLLSDELSAQLKVHLQGCAECRARYDAYQELHRALGALRLEDTEDFVWKGVAETPAVLPFGKKMWVRSIGAAAACFVLVIGVLAVTQNGAFKTTPNEMLPKTVQEKTEVQSEVSVPMKARSVPYAEHDFEIPDGGVTVFDHADTEQKNAPQQENSPAQNDSYDTYSQNTAATEKEPAAETEAASADSAAGRRYTVVAFSVDAQAREAFLQMLSSLVTQENGVSLIAASEIEKLLQLDGVSLEAEADISQAGEEKFAVEYIFEN